MDNKNSDFSIRSLLKKWLQIQSQQEGVFFFGNIAAGKTTLGHLMLKSIDKFQDLNLKFGKKNELQYQGQINPKTTKPLTLYPKIFRIKKSNLNLIQVPSRIYQLEPKKRPYLDKLLNIVCLTYAVKKASFIFFVDAKNTGSKFDVWKKIFQNILDSFRVDFMNQNNFKSMAFLVDKSPSDINEQIYLNRMQALRTLFNQDPRVKQYQQFLKSIEDNKNLKVLHKVTSVSQLSEQERNLKMLHQYLINLPRIQLISKLSNQQNSCLLDQEVQLSKQQTSLLNLFHECLRQILKLIKSILQKIYSSNQNQAQLQLFLQRQLKTPIQLTSNKCIQQDQKFQSIWSKKVVTIYQQLRKKSFEKQTAYQSIIGKSKFMIQYKTIFSEINAINKNYLQRFLILLSQNGLILEFQNFSHPQQLKNVYMKLIQYSIFQERFSSRIKNLNYRMFFQQESISSLFSPENQGKIKQKFYQKNFSPNQSPQNAIKIIQIFDIFFSDQQFKQTKYEEKKLFVKNMLQLKQYNTKQPYKYLPLLFKKLDEFINIKKIEDTIQKKEYSKKLALLAAQMLKNLQRYDLSAKIYSSCGRFYSAKTNYQKLFQGQQNMSKINIDTIVQYINTLTEMKLDQNAILRCYQFAQKYAVANLQVPQKLVNKLKSIVQNKNKVSQFSNMQANIFLNKQYKLIHEYIDEQLLRKIGEENLKIADGNSKKLKNS